MFKYFLAHNAVLHGCKCHGPPLHLCLSSSLGQDECGCVCVCAANLTYKLMSPFVVICWSTITKPYAREILQFWPGCVGVWVLVGPVPFCKKPISIVTPCGYFCYCDKAMWRGCLESGLEQKPAPLVTAVSEAKLLKSGNNHSEQKLCWYSSEDCDWLNVSAENRKALIVVQIPFTAALDSIFQVSLLLCSLWRNLDRNIITPCVSIWNIYIYQDQNRCWYCSNGTTKFSCKSISAKRRIILNKK